MADKFYHVIGSVGDRKVEMLFADLTLKELNSAFVRPYRRGHTFFTGTRVVNPSELQSVRIIETAVLETYARSQINQDDLAQIAEINRTSAFMFVSAGRGYEPDDLAEAGADVTRTYLRGGPGSSVGLLGLSERATGWILSIVAAVAATGAAKWLGWA